MRTTQLGCFFPFLAFFVFSDFQVETGWGGGGGGELLSGGLEDGRGSGTGFQAARNAWTKIADSVV